MKNRRRSEIIELNSEKRYMNELMASNELSISRYYIRKSLNNHIPIRNLMFASYHHGMDIEHMKQQYSENYAREIERSKKWKTLKVLKAQVDRV